jgi:fatty acid desaturase
MDEKKGGLKFMLGIWSLALILSAMGHGMSVLFCWIVPARLAIALVTFSFSYLPHYPHKTLASENRYRATRILLAWWLTPLVVYHNYHLIHHLYPGVPFYRYPKLFALKRDELVAKGAAIWSPQKKKHVVLHSVQEDVG